MKTVSLALIGDIHYPDHKAAARFVDLKDGGITPRITSRIAPDKLKLVSDLLRKKLTKDHAIQAVLLCGDLTSRGDMASYAECVTYLEKILDLSNDKLWKDKDLHVVPGNHDISRTAVDVSDENIFKKFDDIKNVWQTRGRTEMQPDTVRTTDTTSISNGGIARIFSVNSCVGCGEHRYLGSGLKKAIQQVLSVYASTATPDDAFELIGEQLDTPAIDEDHLAKIESSISELQPLNSVPVLLAHHGLLPQAIPRVQIYSELLNGGRIRFALGSHKRPVIYCHGHLHEDPIEIISTPHDGSGKIIVISAPLFVDGFNIINLIFNNDGVPLGCEVTRFRFENGSVLEKEPARISLLMSPSVIEENSTLRCVLDVIKQTKQRFKTILEAVKSIHAGRIGDKILSDALIELEWMGLVEIQNRNSECRHWHARRVAP